MRVLQGCLSMSLRRVGGRSDGGIDLQGWWWLPTDEASLESDIRGHRRLRILAQCKAEAKKLSPKYIREMEGVLHRHMAAPSLSGVDITSAGAISTSAIVGLMISSSPFSKLAALHAHSSPLPFILLHIPERGPKDIREHKPEDVDIPVDENAPSIETPGSIVLNPALVGKNGVLRGQFEARWEYQAQAPGEGRLGLWWKGTRVQSWTPESEATDV